MCCRQCQSPRLESWFVDGWLPEVCVNRLILDPLTVTARGKISGKETVAECPERWICSKASWGTNDNILGLNSWTRETWCQRPCVNTTAASFCLPWVNAKVFSWASYWGHSSTFHSLAKVFTSSYKWISVVTFSFHLDVILIISFPFGSHLPLTLWA